MTRPLTALLSLLAVVVALAAPAAALASPEQILDDCQDGRIDKKYSSEDYRQALKDVPPDLDEYTNCRELIRAAEQGVRSSGGSGPGSDFQEAGGYGALPAGEGGLPLGPDSQPIDPVGIASEEEQKEVEAARSGTDLPDRVSDANASAAGIPASAGVRPGEAAGADVPTPLIVLLVLAGAATLAALVPRLKDLVLRRSA